jgi:molybdopterin molybdotransferase
VAELLTLDEALSCVLERVEPLAAESTGLSECLGRVLREAIRSPVALPPFPSSAMDGFAVRAADTPGELQVALRIAAGSPAVEALPPGSAAGIATGAVVPDGADAVVPVERAVEHDGRVEIADPVTVGQHVRPPGGDVREGDTVVAEGTVVGPAHIGALAAVGAGEVVCSVRPRVVVLATGSELQSAGRALQRGQVYESNRAMIAAALALAGAEVEVLPVVEDEVQALRSALRRGLDADVLVSSGGVSMGPHDLVRATARELGVEEVFWGVAIKPGKPLSFGTRGRTLVFGLPGNPVSSLVGTLVFVRTALLALQGATSPGPRYLIGRASVAIARNPHRDEFVRARREVGAEAVDLRPLSGQESHMIVRSAIADALVHVPRGAGELPAGSAVRYLSLD